MRLRDSLSNPSEPLKRLLTALEKRSESAKPQVKADTTAALIAQTGAEDQALVRLEAKENRKLSPDEVAALMEAYRVGESQRELARRFGMHEQTVRSHLQRFGSGPRPVRSFTDEQEVEITRLYVEEGLSLAKLAAKFSVDKSTIRKAMIRQGVGRRSGGTDPK